MLQMAAHAHVPKQGSPYGNSFCSNHSDPAKTGTHLLTTSMDLCGCGHYLWKPSIAVTVTKSARFDELEIDYCVGYTRRFAQGAVTPATLAQKEEWFGMTDTCSK